MKLKKGNLAEYSMWASVDESILITTNATIKKDGSLVMGAGFAKTMAKMYPNLPKMAGIAIQNVCNYELGYGCIFLPGSFGLFQVKRHFKDNADVSLIVESTLALKEMAQASPDNSYHLNFPGIGYGHLAKEVVFPIIQQLPNNVSIWELDD